MKRILKITLIIIIIFTFISPICLAANTNDKVDFKKQVKNEEGSLFEKILAECIGGLAQTIFDFTTR